MRARVAAALPRPSRSRARAVTTLRRVASQQPMAPAPQVGRTSMRRHTQRTARADAPPVLQVGGAHQCPSRAPPVGRARQCPGSFIAAAPTAAAGHRRIPRMGSGGVRWERACCPLHSRRVDLLAICCRGASSGGRAWRHMPANCIPRRPAHSNVCSQCALGRSATARCPRNAFPSAWRWRYVDVMRSRVSDDGNILPRCIPKRPRTGKGPLRGNISPPCIQNELALARYARHASEKPCKSPLEDTPREYLARKGPFSLRKPLESCTSRRSCHDSAFARPCERKARGAGYRKCTSHCGRRPHPPMITYV